MPLFDTTLWGDVLPGGSGEAEGGEIDVTQVIDEALPSLHAGSRATLHHWTEAELLEWLDDGLKRLARLACVFVGRVASTVTVEGLATYALPPRHIATLHVSHVTRPLRPANTIELEALDPDYQTTEATEDSPITHWYQDLLNGQYFGVRPVPVILGEPLPMIYEGYPVPIDLGQTLVAAPAPLKGYLTMFLLWRAYSKESETEMPDLAAHSKARCELYEQLFTSYYGRGM